MEAVIKVAARIMGWMDLVVGALSLLMALLLIADRNVREAGKGLLLGIVCIGIGSHLLGWW